MDIEKIKLIAGFYRSFALVLFVSFLSIVGWIAINMPTEDLHAWAIVGALLCFVVSVLLSILFFNKVNKS